MRRTVTAFTQTAFLFVAILLLLFTYRRLTSSTPIDYGRFGFPPSETPALQNSPSTESNESTTNLAAPLSNDPPVLGEGNATLLQIAPMYVTAIMDPAQASVVQLKCPVLQKDRYESLRPGTTASVTSNNQLQYFFAVDLHQSVAILPRLLGSVVQTMRFLGPHHCALSIVEGRSDDGTFEVLQALRSEIEQLGAKYYFNSSGIDPYAFESNEKGPSRVSSLASLRNMALAPLTDHPEHYAPGATVIFLNDVSLCAEDILELIYQRQFQGASMTCAMDWTYAGADPTFYDVWIARGMNGDSFFEIPEDGNWNSAWDLFWNNPAAQASLTSHQPFQVFSCWNGVTAFTAEPILTQKITFRAPYEGECIQGEPQIFCKELWYHGYNRIAVIPSVNVEYSDEAATKIKLAKGYVSRWTVMEEDNPERIEWSNEPPEKVKCMPEYSNQYWVPWNESLNVQGGLP